MHAGVDVGVAAGGAEALSRRGEKLKAVKWRRRPAPKLKGVKAAVKLRSSLYKKSG